MGHNDQGKHCNGSEAGMGYNEQREQRRGYNGLMTGMGYNEQEKEQGRVIMG